MGGWGVAPTVGTGGVASQQHSGGREELVVFSCGRKGPEWGSRACGHGYLQRVCLHAERSMASGFLAALDPDPGSGQAWGPR